MELESREAIVGAVVRVRDGYRKPELEGMVGVIEAVWGSPNYTALDVWLENGRSELFWGHQLEAAEREPAPEKHPARTTFNDGS